MNFDLPRALTLSVMVVTLAALGCGSGGNLAPVTGKVTANGQPVTEGTLLFSPIGGAGGEGAIPATAEVKPDGTFTAGTDKPGDGAAVGKHRVTYTAPPPPASDWDGYGKQPEVKKSPFAGMQVQPAEIEVKSGQNDLPLELAPAR